MLSIHKAALSASNLKCSQYILHLAMSRHIESGVILVWLGCLVGGEGWAHIFCFVSKSGLAGTLSMLWRNEHAECMLAPVMELVVWPVELAGNSVHYINVLT